MCIPANFLESVGAASGGDEKRLGMDKQGLSADQYMNSQNFEDKATLLFSLAARTRATLLLLLR